MYIHSTTTPRLSIAFSAISCGVYGYPIDRASRIAVETVFDWLSENSDYEIEVYFVGFNDDVYDALTRNVAVFCEKA